MIIGAALYNAGVTSTGKASEILGLDRRTFLDEMGKYGGVLMKMSIEEVIRDCEIASRF
jgi:predicted HTH domain antitoxin